MRWPRPVFLCAQSLWVWLLWAGGLPADPIPFAEGRLFRLERAEVRPSYLFGTLHADDPEVVRLPEAVETARRQADTLVIEVVPDAEAVLRAMVAMAFTDGRTLRDAVGPELYQQTLRATARLGMGEEAVRDLKPWAVATLLSVPPSATGEFLERRLYASALAEGQTVAGLESIEEQLGVFEGLSAEMQKVLLADALEEQENLDEIYLKLRETYLRGDLAGLLRLNAEYLHGSDPGLRRYFEEVVIDGRNRRMAERLAPTLGRGSAFVAVGALHLPGEAGMLRLLTEQGWSVERVH